MNALPRPTFTYLGHSTIRADLPGGEVVLIDPWVMGNPSCPDAAKEFERIDAMLITHAHSDHMADAVELAKRHKPKVVVSNFEICSWLEAQGVENNSPMNIGGGQDVLGMRVIQVQALHSSGLLDGDRLIYGGDPTGFVIRMPSGYTFYHAGDTALFMDMQLIAELYRPQLAFLPIGDHFTMDPHQAARACKMLEVRQVVPIHWGTFPLLTGTPEQLEDELETLGVNCKVIALQPGDIY